MNNVGLLEIIMPYPPSTGSISFGLFVVSLGNGGMGVRSSAQTCEENPSNKNPATKDRRLVPDISVRTARVFPKGRG